MNKEVRLKVPSEITFYARKGEQDISLSRENLEAIVGFLQGSKSTSPEQFQDLLTKNLISLEVAPSLGLHDFDDVLPEASPSATIYLSPFVNVEIAFSVNREPLPRSNGELIDVFIARDFMKPWYPFLQNLSVLADSMLKNALTRGKAPNPREILKVLHDVCIQECAKEPLSKFLVAKRDSEGKFQFLVKHDFSVQREACQYPEINFRLQGNDAYLSERFIVSDEYCPYVTRLFQKLNHGASKSALIEFAVNTPNPHALKRILQTLKQIGGLTSQPSATKPDWDQIMPPRADLSVYHFGHASLLVRGGSSFITFDPWFLTWDAKYQTQPLSAFQLPPLEAIFITHHHWDHINPQSILKYPEGVPIVVPKQDRNCAIYPRFLEFLKLFGHETIVELGHWEKYPLRDGGFVIAVPFTGEGTAESEFRRNCYLVERWGQRILVHADSSQDSNGKSDLTEGVIQKLVRDYGPIDVVYATRRQELDFGIQSWYLLPITMAERPYHWLDVVENCNCPKEYLASLAKETGCKKLLLYSEGGAEWYRERTNFLRSGKEDVQFQAFEYLWDTLEDIRTEITKTSECNVELSEPMTLVTLEAGTITAAQRLLDSK